jgi:hypothetical protein
LWFSSQNLQIYTIMNTPVCEIDENRIQNTLLHKRVENHTKAETNYLTQLRRSEEKVKENWSTTLDSICIYFANGCKSEDIEND